MNRCYVKSWTHTIDRLLGSNDSEYGVLLCHVDPFDPDMGYLGVQAQPGQSGNTRQGYRAGGSSEQLCMVRLNSPTYYRCAVWSHVG
jgi:hypothetical protein